MVFSGKQRVRKKVERGDKRKQQKGERKEERNERREGRRGKQGWKQNKGTPFEEEKNDK
jgi:hypothetical protein